MWVLTASGPDLAMERGQADVVALKENAEARQKMLKRFKWGDSIDPRGDCVFIEGPDRFTIQVPPGVYQLFPGQDGNFDAPRLVQNVDGDFSLVVKVEPFELQGESPEGRKKSAYQGAGLVVWHDSNNWIRTLWSQRPPVGANPFEHTHVQEGGITLRDAIRDLKPGQQYLNLERNGKTFRVRWGTDGKTWDPFVALPAVDFPQKLRVGLLAVNESTAGFAPQFEAYRVDLVPPNQLVVPRPGPKD
jgi:regulation of enolase protein 1 (concanavalin A-like superfamily)